MKRTSFIPIIAAAVALGILVSAAPDHVFGQAGTNGRGALELDVRAGSEWLTYLRRFLFVKQPKPPQLAVWLEDSRGRFVATLFVTHRTATQDWEAIPAETQRTGRRSYALPVWIHTQIQGGIYPLETCSACHDRVKSADKSTDGVPVLDTMTGATPMAGFTRTRKIPASLKPDTYTVRAELNHSLDYNDAYPNGLPENDTRYSGVSGQPSLLLTGRITIGDRSSSTTLRPVARGNPNGTDGAVIPDLEGITTARNIASSITVRYDPGR